MTASVRAYLEGATPTKFGPKPLKRERGPSFSNINLKTKQKNILLWLYHQGHVYALGRYFSLVDAQHIFS